MSKTIKFEYKGVDYVLEYTKRSVQQMEKNGFVASDIESKPMTMLPSLFAGAFLAHHRFTKQDVIDDIYAHFPNRDKLIEKLVDMFNEPILEMIEEPDENEGNVDWTANF